MMQMEATMQSVDNNEENIILVIEDEELTGKALVKTLKILGYKAMHVLDANSARKAIYNGHNYLLLIMDVYLTKRMDTPDGILIFEEMMEKGIRTPTKFISAFTDRVNLSKIRGYSNFDGFHSKPVSYHDLEENLMNLMCKLKK